MQGPLPHGTGCQSNLGPCMAMHGHALQSGAQSVVAIAGIAPHAPHAPQADDTATPLATTVPCFHWHHTSQTTTKLPRAYRHWRQPYL
jgi:hypothetical protein